MRRKKPHRARIANAIDKVCGYVVELWPEADPRCFASTHESLSLHHAIFFEALEEAEAVAKLQDRYGSGTNSRVLPARRTNQGAERLMAYRISQGDKLETLAPKFNISVKYASQLCWGLTLPSLPVAGVIREVAAIPLDQWLQPCLSLEFHADFRLRPQGHTPLASAQDELRKETEACR